MKVDWESLARDLGSFTEVGETSGTTMARQALDRLIGDAEWEAAVDHYVGWRRGSSLARSVMWHVHPWAAMVRCHEIVQTSADQEKRRTAVELLQVVADNRALPWVDGYLNDVDEGDRDAVPR